MLDNFKNTGVLLDNLKNTRGFYWIILKYKGLLLARKIYAI